jgi:hypothetical protein
VTNAITYSLSGRLGNHLQLLACARVLALRYGWRFVYHPILAETDFALAQKFPRSLSDTLDRFLVDRFLALPYKVKPTTSRRHELAQTLLRPFRRVVYLDDASWDTTAGRQGELTAVYRSMRDTLFVLRFNGIFRNLGAERSRVVSEILPASLRPVPIASVAEVGLHIRRDDTEYGLPLKYYFSAVRAAQAQIAQPLHLHLFSDGAHESLAAELQKQLSNVTIYIERGSPVNDILALARYPTLILSMSWFSYWAAMFSQAATIYTAPAFHYYPEWQPIDF